MVTCFSPGMSNWHRIVQQRLKAIRIAITEARGESQQKIAKAIGTAKSTFSGWEKDIEKKTGKPRTIPAERASALWYKYQIHPECIYLGKFDRVPNDILGKIPTAQLADLSRTVEPDLPETAIAHAKSGPTRKIATRRSRAANMK